MATKSTKEAITDPMKVEVAFPECVRIELVQVNELKHYEIFSGLGSLFSTAAAGFWVSYATTDPNKILLSVSITFSVFTVIFGLLAWHSRKKLTAAKITKTIHVKELN